MRVLLNDGFDKEGIELFQKHGVETDTRKRDLGELTREIGEFDGLVVRSATKVTPEIIKAGAEGLLKVIGRAGVGIDNIDEDATNEHYVVIKYAPAGSTNAVAEHAIGLMLAVSRNIPQAYHELKDGKWLKKQFMGTELSNKTLGIIGCGRIGQKLSQIASLAFGMSVLGYEENLDRVRLLYSDSRIRYSTKEEVISRADYLSIHTGGSNVVIGAQELALMKKEAYLINTSRDLILTRMPYTKL